MLSRSRKKKAVLLNTGADIFLFSSLLLQRTPPSPFSLLLRTPRRTFPCCLRVGYPSTGQVERAMVAVGGIIRAAESGALEAVRRLLDEDPGAINHVRHRTWTPLVGAAYRGHVDVVRLLLDRGANINPKAAGGETALYRAAHNGHVEVVNLLLDRGARIDYHCGLLGQTAFMIACSQGHLPVARLLLRRTGQHVDETTRYNMTSLWWACFWGKTEVAWALLVEEGADYTIADHIQGRTPRQIALHHRHQACVDLIDWFEKEMERPYLLHKARRVFNDYVMREKFPQASHAIPCYLRERARLSMSLPTMRLVAPPPPSAQAAPGGEGVKVKGGERRGEGKDELEEEEREDTLSFVIEGLNCELYRELSDGLRLR